MSGWELVRARARLSDTAVAATAVLLASGCLIPLFTDLSWLPPVIVMVVILATLGAASRALAMPLPFVPLAQALGLILTLTALVAAPQAWARIVPTSEAWDVVRTLVRQGMVDAQTYSAPVPMNTGLVLLAVGGVGLVALSTDTLFVSVRAPMLASLPLLALYLVPALVLPLGAPWWALPLPAAGWLLILAADQRERIREWGGLAGTARIRGLSAGARRIGLLAVALATVTAVVVPVSTAAPWRSGQGDGVGGGPPQDGGAVILDPLVTMRRSLIQLSDAEVLRYRTQATKPSYLRVSVLEDFDGTTWLPREGLATGRDSGVPLPGNVLSASIALDDANRVRGGDSFTYDITVTNLANAYLPLPYPVSEVTDIDGLGTDWSIDPSTGVGFSADQPATGLVYRVAALDPRFQAAQLRDASAAAGDLWPLLNLPGGLSPQIEALAKEVTAEASTPYDKAVALQRWFTRDGGFTYSTDVRSGADADYMAEFLTDRIGYCEQFAGAMAIMARTLGIPSRVAVGFTQGSLDEDGSWRVSARDAHAWPELWFDGVGWARFEPTPRSGGTVLTPDYARTPDGASDVIPLEPNGRLPAEEIERPRGGPSGPQVPFAAILGLLMVAALAMLAVPMVRRVVRRRRRLRARRYADVVDGAWAEIGDLAIDLGQTWSAFATPRQAGDRLARGMPEQAAAALRRVRQEVERVRYARMGGSGESAERAEAVRADVQVVTRELRGRVRWQTRVAAYCWPSSERRRQRSSMRVMNPEEAGGFGAAGFAGAAASSAERAPKAE